jgi:hypothetical protein
MHGNKNVLLAIVFIKTYFPEYEQVRFLSLYVVFIAYSIIELEREMK